MILQKMAQMQRVALLNPARFRFCSVFNPDGEGARLMMEREIRQTLSKLARLSQVIPESDPRAKRAAADHGELQSKFAEVVFGDE